MFFNKQTSAHLRAALDTFEATRPPDPLATRANALRFTWTHFRSGIGRVVNACLAGQIRS